MLAFAWMRHRAWALCACLLLSTWGSPASAGTGIYWSFVNHTAQDLQLWPRPDSTTSGCWDVSRFPLGSIVPAGQTSTYYVEFGSCMNTELTVFIAGGPYDRDRVKIWADEQWPGRFRVTRNIQRARSSKALANPVTFFIGTSSSDMSTSLAFTGEGIRDTLRAGVAFSAHHALPPPGSYLETCDADYDEASGVVRTDCLDGSSGIVYDARLHYTRLCAPGSLVSNLSGQPTCDRYVDGLPGGSYLQSCRPVEFDSASGVLQAECPDGRQAAPKVVSLDVHYACERGSTLSNRYGELVCDRPFSPVGPYLDACKDPSYDGRVLSATCRSFVPLGRLSLDYAARCAPWSEVRLDAGTSALVCDAPSQPQAGSR